METENILVYGAMPMALPLDVTTSRDYLRLEIQRASHSPQSMKMLS